jgi:hypothetical protein
MIQLIKGSIFDSKCDLIIIPCNGSGSVSSTIHKDIVTNNLPYMYKPIYAGEIQFIENVGNFSNSQMIGYAASVGGGSASTAKSNQQSTESNIQSILRELKLFCRKQSLRKVNIPLLGTGAGGLTAEASLKVMKSEFDHERDILLCVYILSTKFYDDLVIKKENSYVPILKSPRVFISYTGTDLANRSWVKAFAARLRSSGINARVDIYHLKPGQDLPQWMTNELIMADKVLLICDKYYAEKADSRNGGVGWETMIIQGDMMAHQEQNKYIAILRGKDIDQSLPIYMKSKYALNWSEDKQVDNDYNELLLNLFDCDVEPEMGEIPDFIQAQFHMAKS